MTTATERMIHKSKKQKKRVKSKTKQKSQEQLVARDSPQGTQESLRQVGEALRERGRNAFLLAVLSDKVLLLSGKVPFPAARRIQSL